MDDSQLEKWLELMNEEIEFTDKLANQYVKDEYLSGCYTGMNIGLRRAVYKLNNIRNCK